jgi:hypothetical protein
LDYSDYEGKDNMEKEEVNLSNNRSGIIRSANRGWPTIYGERDRQGLDGRVMNQDSTNREKTKIIYARYMNKYGMLRFRMETR